VPTESCCSAVLLNKYLGVARTCALRVEHILALSLPVSWY